MSEIEPSHTIYIKNLPDKGAQKELKLNLYMLFGQYGRIIDIHMRASVRTRGQAWVSFDSIASAVKALRALQGFKFYSRKPMVLDYSVAKSNAVAMMDGTYVAQPKKSKAEKRALSDVENNNDDAVIKRPKRDAGATHRPSSGSSAAVLQNPPHRVLLLTNLPEDTTDASLNMLFGRYPGLKEIRMVAGRHDLAFVEYQTEMLALDAKAGLSDFNIKPNHPLVINFAKKTT